MSFVDPATIIQEIPWPYIYFEVKLFSDGPEQKYINFKPVVYVCLKCLAYYAGQKPFRHNCEKREIKHNFFENHGSGHTISFVIDGSTFFYAKARSFTCSNCKIIVLGFQELYNKTNIILGHELSHLDYINKSCEEIMLDNIR